MLFRSQGTYLLVRKRHKICQGEINAIPEKGLRNKEWKGGKEGEKDKLSVKGILAMSFLVTITTTQLKAP